MQAWLRLSRSKLILDMSTQALQIIKTKNKSIDFFLKFNPSEKSDINLEKLNYIKTEISLRIEHVVENDPHFQKLSNMLINMDSVCYVAMKTFQTLLPEMEARTYVQRQKILRQILKKYSMWLKMEEPNAYVQTVVSTSNDDISSHIDSDVLRREVSWEEYCLWYAERSNAMNNLEKDYASLIEDEREKEGRLMRKWCSLALSNMRNSSISSNNNDNNNNSTNDDIQMGDQDDTHMNINNSERVEDEQLTQSKSINDDVSSDNDDNNKNHYDNDNDSNNDENNDSNNDENNDYNDISDMRIDNYHCKNDDNFDDFYDNDNGDNDYNHDNSAIKPITQTLSSSSSSSSSSKTLLSTSQIIPGYPNKPVCMDTRIPVSTDIGIPVCKDTRIPVSTEIQIPGFQIPGFSSKSIPHKINKKKMSFSPRCVSAFMKYFNAYYTLELFDIGVIEVEEQKKEVELPFYS
jgi:hypothetical protein